MSQLITGIFPNRDIAERAVTHLIDAGFAPGEIPLLMGLPSKCWQIEEHSTWRGAARMLGWRV